MCHKVLNRELFPLTYVFATLQTVQGFREMMQITMRKGIFSWRLGTYYETVMIHAVCIYIYRDLLWYLSCSVNSTTPDWLAYSINHEWLILWLIQYANQSGVELPVCNSEYCAGTLKTPMTE